MAMKNKMFEFKINEFQTIYNNSIDETEKGNALMRLSDVITCAEYRSLIRTKHKDNKPKQAELMMKLFSQYIHYRKRIESLETAKLYAYDIDFDSKGRPIKAVSIPELDRIIKAFVREPARHVDNDDSMEVFMSVCCELQKCANENGGKLDLFSEYTFTDLQTKVIKKGEKTVSVKRTETYMHRCFRSARRTIDERSSVKALVNGITYLPAYDEETERTYYVNYGKYADVNKETASIDTMAMLERIGATPAQIEVCEIIDLYNGDISQRDIADVLHIDVSSVRDRLKGVRKKLMLDDKASKIYTEMHLYWFIDSVIDDDIDDEKEYRMNYNALNYMRLKKARAHKASLETVNVSKSSHDAYDFDYWKQSAMREDERMRIDEKRMVWDSLKDGMILSVSMTSDHYTPLVTVPYISREYVTDETEKAETIRNASMVCGITAYGDDN